jgi:hypothetical protein
MFKWLEVGGFCSAVNPGNAKERKERKKREKFLAFFALFQRFLRSSMLPVLVLISGGPTHKRSFPTSAALPRPLK